MKNYLKNLLAEKNINPEMILEVEGKMGLNIMPLQVVIDGILSTCREEQQAIRKTLVMIDFKNGDVLHFFRHLAGALAV